MKILVIGDSCIDRFVYCDINRICPEAPVPVLNPIKVVENEGMAGNVVKNLESLGATVELVTNKDTQCEKHFRRGSRKQRKKDDGRRDTSTHKTFPERWEKKVKMTQTHTQTNIKPPIMLSTGRKNLHTNPAMVLNTVS